MVVTKRRRILKTLLLALALVSLLAWPAGCYDGPSPSAELRILGPVKTVTRGLIQPDGSRLPYSVARYDFKGALVSEEISWGDPGAPEAWCLSYSRRCEYDEAGRLARLTDRDVLGGNDTTTVRYYEADGRLARIELTDGDGLTTYLSIYDEAGIRVREEIWSPDGVKSAETRFTYDEGGRLVKGEVWEATSEADPVVIHYYPFPHGDLGRQEIWFSPAAEMAYIFSFDQYDNRTATTLLSLPGEGKVMTLAALVSKGEATPPGYAVAYKYDQYGNWIELTPQTPKLVAAMQPYFSPEYREITYCE